MYKIRFVKSAEKEFKKLSRDLQIRIGKRINALADNPRLNAEKLKGADAWRIRVGDYRVVYQIQEGKLLILVLKTQHRREVYRKL